MIYELKSQVEGIDAIDLCAPAKPFTRESRAAQAALLGYVERNQRAGGMAMLSALGQVAQEAATKQTADEVEQEKTVEAAKGILTLASQNDNDFIVGVIDRLTALRKADRGILKNDDKPINDLVFNSIDTSDLALIAVHYTNVFLMS